jgi:hypothetical protein
LLFWGQKIKGGKMKRIFLLLMFFATVAGNAQSGFFKNGSIKLEYRPSPLFYMFNESATNKAGSSGWLLVRVKYSTPSRRRGKNPMWVDDVTMETELVMPVVYKSKNVTALLKGKTVFWSIPLDGKSHNAIGCVPPQAIARFARKGNKIDTSKMIARVTFYSSSRKILLQIYSSSSSRVRNYFSKLGGAVSSGVLTVDDIIMPRNKTPWGVFNFELYDLIKPDSQK